jgi:hypothetical protein
VTGSNLAGGYTLYNIANNQLVGTGYVKVKEDDAAFSLATEAKIMFSTDAPAGTHVKIVLSATGDKVEFGDFEVEN